MSGGRGPEQQCEAKTAEQPPLPPLQGFGHVRVNALLASAASLLEMAGSAAALVLLRSQPASGAAGDGRGLLAVGCVTAACQALLTAAALACVAAMPPREARGCVHLGRDVFRLRPGAAQHAAGSTSPDHGPREPLLDGGGGGGGGAQQQLPGATGDAPLAVGGLGLLDGPTLEFLRWLAAAPCPLAAAGPGMQPPSSLPAACATGFDRPASADLAPPLNPNKPCRDGRDMFIRSLMLQLTFFAALAAASRLGTAALAGGRRRAAARGMRRAGMRLAAQSLPGLATLPQPTCSLAPARLSTHVLRRPQHHRAALGGGFLCGGRLCRRRHRAGVAPLRLRPHPRPAAARQAVRGKGVPGSAMQGARACAAAPAPCARARCTDRLRAPPRPSHTPQAGAWPG